MATAPAISVVMPVFNASRHLDDAVRSILAQTFTQFELIAVDDGSADDSLAIVRRLAALDGRVRVIELGRRGIVAALNRGIGESSGAFIARMDSDDIARPDRLARQLSFLLARPQIAAVGSAYDVIDDSGAIVKTIEPPTDPDQIAATLQRTNCVAHPTAMIRRSALGDVMPYRSAYRLAEDYDLWLRLAERHGLANLPIVTVSYRRRFDADRIGDLVQQSLSALAARAAARLRASGQSDPTGTWEVVTRENAASLGVRPRDIAREVRRNALALARQAYAHGAQDAAARYVAVARDHAPRSEGPGAWLTYRWQRTKVRV